MFEAADIREWRGHDVVDDAGHKIGTLGSVYVDTGSDQPSFATVTVGLPIHHRLVFVPLDTAAVGPGYLRSPLPPPVKDSPSTDADGGRRPRRRKRSQELKPSLPAQGARRRQPRPALISWH